MPNIRIDVFNKATIDAAIKAVEDYSTKVQAAAEKIAKGLADLGYQVAVGILGGHVWSGETLGSLTVEQVGEGQYVLYAQSAAILFFEFGAGVREGYGHPMAEDLGMGPGTYPGKGNWDNPKGWWFITDDPRLAVHTTKDGVMYAHSYGNKPHMPFYQADQAMRQDIVRIAKEALAK